MNEVPAIDQKAFKMQTPFRTSHDRSPPHSAEDSYCTISQTSHKNSNYSPKDSLRLSLFGDQMV